MAKTNRKDPVAAAFAGSLLEIATERQQAEPVGTELDDLARLIEAEPTFKAFLSDPAIGQSEREQVLERAVHGQVSPLVENFLRVLSRRGRLGALEQIAEAYQDLLDEQLGKIEVDLTVAQRLQPDQLEQVRRKISEALKKDAVLHQYVDESIIGGMVLRVQDRLIDGSVKAQLAALRAKLLK